jgi:hypothetical protein
MKVLYLGDNWLGSNARSMATGVRLSGHDVVHIDTTTVSRPRRYGHSWTYLKVRGHRLPADVTHLHDLVDQAVREFRPDILFCFKTIHLDQERLLSYRGVRTIHYSADDVSNPVNISSSYLRHESAWDLIVTTKRHNVGELHQRGVKNVLFVWSAYDPAWHHPCPRVGLARFTVGFVGNARPDRLGILSRMGAEFGSEMAVFGPGWGNKRSPIGSHGVVVGDAVYGERFSATVALIDANLILLNSENRDTHTCRSFEIPAAGGLFVGQRTDEHSEMIDHGVNGYLFSDENELFEICRAIRASPGEARTVADRGHQAITHGRNTYADRAREILSHVTSM